METVSDFIFLGSKITADGDCNHEIKRCFLLGRKALTNLDSILKIRDITLQKKGCLGNVMSTAAVKVLRQHGIEAHWDTLTEFIRNRAGTDLCPIESATAQIDDPEEALQAILSKLASLESAQY